MSTVEQIEAIHAQIKACQLDREKEDEKRRERQRREEEQRRDRQLREEEELEQMAQLRQLLEEHDRVMQFENEEEEPRATGPPTPEQPMEAQAAQPLTSEVVEGCGKRKRDVKGKARASPLRDLEPEKRVRSERVGASAESGAPICERCSDKRLTCIWPMEERGKAVSCNPCRSNKQKCRINGKLPRRMRDGAIMYVRKPRNTITIESLEGPVIASKGKFRFQPTKTAVEKPTSDDSGNDEGPVVKLLQGLIEGQMETNRLLRLMEKQQESSLDIFSTFNDNATIFFELGLD